MSATADRLARRISELELERAIDVLRAAVTGTGACISIDEQSPHPEIAFGEALETVRVEPTRMRATLDALRLVESVRREAAA